MKKQLITATLTAAVAAGAAPQAYANEADADQHSYREHIGTGIGAVAGGILGGPIGLLAGGLIGNLAARHDAAAAEERISSGAEPAAHTETLIPALPEPVHTPAPDTAIVISQAGDIGPVIDDAATDEAALKRALVNELGLDVLFLTGSTSVESIYLPRLQALAGFVQLLPGIEVHLEGYSDRRGDSDANLDLSTRRLESVRDCLVQAGVDADRIHVNAHGEKQFVSAPGDLEAYTFDRRVVVRFEPFAPESDRPIAMIETEATQ